MRKRTAPGPPVGSPIWEKMRKEEIEERLARFAKSSSSEKEGKKIAKVSKRKVPKPLHRNAINHLNRLGHCGSLQILTDLQEAGHGEHRCPCFLAIRHQRNEFRT